MKRRLFATVLASVLLLSLCACAPQTQPTQSTPSTTAPAQPTTAQTQPDTQPDDGRVTYLVRVTDENGTPLPDVMVQLCLTSCIPGSTGQSGTAEFRLEAGDYHASVMVMPEGYDYIGAETEFYFETGKTELTIVLKGTSAETQPEQTEPKQTDPAPTEPKQTEPEPTETAPAEPTDPPEGSRANPLSCYPDASSDISETTITLPELAGGSSIYCNVYRVGGRQLIIENPNAFVVYKGKRYTAQNGKVSIQLDDVMADRPLLMEIGNSGSGAATFVLKCQSPAGTFENPTVLSVLDGSAQTLHLEQGDQLGYYYLYTAAKAGTVRVTLARVTGGDVTAELENTSNSKTVSTDNEFAGKGYVELEVAAGDVLRIHLSVLADENWQIAAADVTWNGTFA